jgi:hypothetical protein
VKIDLDEYRLDPDFCCYCGKDRTMTDQYSLPWCEEHKPRGRLLNWGWHHRFPNLECKPFAIGAGEFCWYVAIVAGTNDLIRAAFAALPHLETVSVPIGALVRREASKEPVSRERRVPSIPTTKLDPSATASAIEQEVTRLRKEVRLLAGRMKPFFEETSHQDTHWESSGRMHPNGTITEKDYLARVVNAIRIGDTLVLKDVIEAMQHTLSGGKP